MNVPALRPSPRFGGTYFAAPKRHPPATRQVLDAPEAVITRAPLRSVDAAREPAGVVAAALGRRDPALRAAILRDCSFPVAGKGVECLLG